MTHGRTGPACGRPVVLSRIRAAYEISINFYEKVSVPTWPAASPRHGPLTLLASRPLQHLRVDRPGIHPPAGEHGRRGHHPRAHARLEIPPDPGSDVFASPV